MTEKKSRRFLKGLLIYAALLLLLGGAVLGLLHRYLIVFEATRPETAMRAYWEELMAGGSDEACRAALGTLDENIRSQTDSLAFISGLLRRSEYREDVGQSSEEERVYNIRADGQPLGRVTLRHSGPTRFGMTAWAVDEEAFDFSDYIGSVSVTVPPDYCVILGNTTLDASYIADDAVPYEHLAECYGTLDNLPRMVRYDSGRYIGDTPLRVLDAAGREVSADQRNELYYLDNCDEALRSELAAFAEDFILRYIRFTANIEQEYEIGYSNLAWLVVPGSSLSTRLRQAALDGWWSNATSCALERLELRLMSDLGENGWLVDLGYTTRTSTVRDTVTDDYNARLLVTRTYGRLRAYALYFY